MRTKVEIAQDVVDEIMDLFAMGINFTEIARRVELSYYVVRSRIEPGWADRYEHKNNSYRRERRKYVSKAPPPMPPKALVELAWPSLDARLTGTPAIGRSALERKASSGPRLDRFQLTPDEAYIDSYMRVSDRGRASK